MARLFISQKRLDEWSVQNKVELAGERMTLIQDGRSFVIRPAVLFVGVAGNDADHEGLVGKVKDEDSLAAMGADLYMNSVIVRDTAYDVQCGFIGDPVGPGA
jgi:hypothetical protein